MCSTGRPIWARQRAWRGNDGVLSQAIAFADYWPSDSKKPAGQGAMLVSKTHNNRGPDRSVGHAVLAREHFCGAGSPHPGGVSTRGTGANAAHRVGARLPVHARSSLARVQTIVIPRLVARRCPVRKRDTCTRQCTCGVLASC